ncbi:MAG TPA: response regulator [Verrucomicrobiae bacterium]|nr:response regulator [Verrucomicrobiae bacterium]
MARLLLIDDDDATRRMIRSRLESAYEILETSDPEEGIVLALQQKPDAILLDLMMPKYTGFEVCQTLSSMSFSQRIPIFIVSGESAERYRDFCRNIGARAFIQKPIDFGALRKELQAVVSDGAAAKRPEARVRIRTPLRLKGLDATGTQLDSTIVTENVTTRGFLCGMEASIAEGTVVEVYLAGNAQRFAGKARVVRVDSPGTRGQMCDLEFLEHPVDWVLP